MKVLYDHQIFESQKIGGISRYFSELIKFNPSSLISLKYSDNVYLNTDILKKYKILPKKYESEHFLPKINFKGKGRLLRIYNKLLKKNNLSISIDTLKKGNFDVFHPTYYDSYFIDYLNDKPFVLTIYDMIHEYFPQYFSTDVTTILNKKKLALKANQIIAISESTKRDIIEVYPEIDEKKISVIYLGTSFYSSIDNPKKKDEYILFTGNRGAYKNFNTFIYAVAPLLLKYNINLICTGPSFNNAETDLLKELHIFDKVLYKLVSDRELAKLYSEALAFIFPSLYEGFGIPVLEAFATGCPAILSNTSSLPEVGGEAAVYFDPYSIDDMRLNIEQVITSEGLQKELIAKGKEQLKKFSWENCYNETLQVYKRLLK